MHPFSFAERRTRFSDEERTERGALLACWLRELTFRLYSLLPSARSRKRKPVRNCPTPRLHVEDADDDECNRAVCIQNVPLSRRVHWQISPIDFIATKVSMKRFIASVFIYVIHFYDSQMKESIRESMEVHTLFPFYIHRLAKSDVYLFFSYSLA